MHYLNFNQEKPTHSMMKIRWTWH